MKSYRLNPNKAFSVIYVGEVFICRNTVLWPPRGRKFFGAPPPAAADDFEDAFHDEDLVDLRPHIRTDIWEEILQEVDFQQGRWFLWDYELNPIRWSLISDERAQQVLRSYGFKDPILRRQLARLFRYRTSKTNRIKHSGEDMGYPFNPEWRPKLKLAQGELL
jgi:hypothetical protein